MREEPLTFTVSGSAHLVQARLERPQIGLHAGFVLKESSMESGSGKQPVRLDEPESTNESMCPQRLIESSNRQNGNNTTRLPGTDNQYLLSTYGKKTNKLPLQEVARVVH